MCLVFLVIIFLSFHHIKWLEYNRKIRPFLDFYIFSLIVFSLSIIFGFQPHRMDFTFYYRYILFGVGSYYILKIIISNLNHKKVFFTKFISLFIILSMVSLNTTLQLEVSVSANPGISYIKEYDNVLKSPEQSPSLSINLINHVNEITNEGDYILAFPETLMWLSVDLDLKEAEEALFFDFYYSKSLDVLMEKLNCRYIVFTGEDMVNINGNISNVVSDPSSMNLVYINNNMERIYEYRYYTNG